ncbi:MAG TPA: hypothetical protein P5528_02850 [Steroidobacteraceae bacterium]|nr:hypothetical protein [Steroidobacteraceae bacterium]HRX88362.1 hypothetical protein [Steroidobacteraceae bacterium]
MSTAFLGNPLIAELLDDPARFKQEGHAYQLLEEYFSGFPVETLRPLMRHENGLVRHAALWVASELGEQACVLLGDAIPLIASDDRFESYHALEIAAVCAVGDQVERFVAVVAGLESSDGVIRGLTMRLMSRADAAQLRAAAAAAVGDTRLAEVHKRGLELLAIGDTVDPNAIKRFLTSEDGVARSYGAIAAKRLSNKYPELLEVAASLPDTSVSKFAGDAA